METAQVPTQKFAPTPSLATVVFTRPRQVHLTANAIDKGADCLAKAVLQARDCNYVAGEATSLERLAQLHSSCGREHEALVARQEALELRQQGGLEVSTKAEAELLLDEARTLVTQGVHKSWEKAIEAGHSNRKR
eukprot:144948-Amphidinium_carterae.1